MKLKEILTQDERHLIVDEDVEEMISLPRAGDAELVVALAAKAHLAGKKGEEFNVKFVKEGEKEAEE